MKRLTLMGLILIVSACGAGVIDAGPISTTQPPDETPTTESPTLTTTSTTSTLPPTTTTTVPGSGTAFSVYFFVEDVGDVSRPGPFLVPVYREVPKTQAVATAALRELLAGPTEAERNSVPALSTAVPHDTLLLGITIEEGVATVDLSREFESGGGSFSMFGRLAQVVFTVTQFPTVEAVAFRLDGEPVTVFSGEGITLDEPVGRDDYLDLMSTVFVDRPAYGGPLGNPARLVGMAAVFEAVFQVAIVDVDGLVLVQTPAMTDEGMGWGDFDVTIPYDVPAVQMGSLVVWVFSAKDGSQIDTREYPVVLTPAG